MTTRTFDDREHRRGLVLGLTLAEVLLLLLFVLMLTLTWRVVEVQQELEMSEVQLASAEAKLAELGVVVDGPLPTEMPQPEVIAAAVALLALLGPDTDAVLDALAKRPEVAVEALRLMEATGADASDLAAIGQLFEEARAIDPDDPPTVLREGIEYQAAVERRLAEASMSPLSAEEVAAVVIAYGKGEHDWPPIISLSEADGYSFRSGQASLTAEFRTALEGPIIDQLFDLIGRYDVNVVEVIGHTDQVPMNGRASNLDRTLIDVMATPEADIGLLAPADNSGLGMARAVAVAKVLLASPRLTSLGVRVLPLSGAQMIAPADQLAVGGGGESAELRRIEIRLRRSTEATAL